MVKPTLKRNPWSFMADYGFTNVIYIIKQSRNSIHHSKNIGIDLLVTRNEH